MNKTDNTQLISALIVAVVGIVSVTTLMIVVPENNSATLLIGFVGLALTNVLQFRLAGKIQELHVLTNSRMSELLSVSKSASKAEGIKEGEKLANESKA